MFTITLGWVGFTFLVIGEVILVGLAVVGLATIHLCRGGFEFVNLKKERRNANFHN